VLKSDISAESRPVTEIVDPVMSIFDPAVSVSCLPASPSVTSDELAFVPTNVVKLEMVSGESPSAAANSLRVFRSSGAESTRSATFPSV